MNDQNLESIPSTQAHPLHTVSSQKQAIGEVSDGLVFPRKLAKVNLYPAWVFMSTRVCKSLCV